MKVERLICLIDVVMNVITVSLLIAFLILAKHQLTAASRPRLSELESKWVVFETT